jgi:hypothetical protein
MRYEDAIELISRAIPISHIAQAAGMSEDEVRRSLLPASGSDRYVPPPANWRQILAQLAWERAAVLQELATRLEREAERALV